MIPIYFLINALETALFTVYIMLDSSEKQQQVLFNLSPQRLILVILLVIITSLFLSIAYTCWKKGRIGQKITDILRNERANWIMFSISGVVMLASLVYLTRDADQLGNFRNYYLELQPIFSWICFLSGQAIFFLATNLFFNLNSSGGNMVQARKEFRNVWIIFLAAIIVKFLLVTRNSNGPINWDGMEYFFSAYFMNQGDFFSYEMAIHYPPLYYLLFVWTIPFDFYAYDLIKVMNIMLSSSLIFPVYLIARKYLGKKESLWIVIILSLMPFHLVFPPRIQSENLYFPLFCWSIYLVLESPKNPRFRDHWDLMTGLCLGLLYLTRYITLSALPAFFIGWWLKPFPYEKKKLGAFTEKGLHFCMVLLAAGVAYLPWILLGVSHGNTIKNMLGFVITAVVENPAQLSFLNLIKWAMIYICYLILMAAPFLHLIIHAIKQAIQDKLDIQTRNWFILSTMLLASYGAAAVRHSWRENYNSVLPTKIMGRYFIYLMPILLITAFIGLDRYKKRKEESFLKFALTIFVIPYGLVVFAFLCDITRSIVPMAETVIKKWGSVDGYLIVLMGNWFLPAIAAIFILSGLFLWKGEKEKALAGLCVTLIAFYLGRTPAYYNDLQTFEMENSLGKQAAMEIREAFPNDYASRSIRLFVPDNFDVNRKQRIYMSTRIRGIHQLEQIPYFDNLSEFDLKQGDFVIEAIPGEIDDDFEYRIETYPFD